MQPLRADALDTAEVTSDIKNKCAAPPVIIASSSFRRAGVCSATKALWREGRPSTMSGQPISEKFARDQMRTHMRQPNRALPGWFLLLCALSIALLPLAGQAEKKKSKGRGMWTHLKSLSHTCREQAIALKTPMIV